MSPVSPPKWDRTVPPSMRLVRAVGFEPTICSFRGNRGRPNSPTPLLGRGSGETMVVLLLMMIYLSGIELGVNYLFNLHRANDLGPGPVNVPPDVGP